MRFNSKTHTMKIWLFVFLCVLFAIAATEARNVRGGSEEPPQKEEGQERINLEAPRFKERKELDVDKRSGTAVSEATIHLSDGSSYVKSVEEMCVYAHNYVRSKHKTTPSVTWDSTLAAECESYAQELADTGVLVHSSKAINGEFGENLYLSANTYGAISTPAHALYSWYSESWVPKVKGGGTEYYDYSFNPSNSTQLRDKGVGHFTAAIWRSSTSVCCGVATKTYMKDDYSWTRTVVVARYKPNGNILNQFPQYVKPLKSGDASLEGQIRVGDCLPGPAGCKSTFNPSTCSLYQNYGYCHIVEADCNCQCP